MALTGCRDIVIQMRSRSLTLAFSSVVALVGFFGGCADWAWSSLYGKYCGDELVDQEEDCQPVRCGDGVVSAGEECDDANLSDADGCLSSCELASCGDGIVWSAVEDCDDGGLESGDGCSERCRHESVCGDGAVSGLETCDDGGSEPGDGCSPDCQIEPDPVACGNGKLDAEEVCDDGNHTNEDRCLSGCTWATCGDGVTREGVEDCEDGNANSEDGCTRSCIQCGEPGTLHWTGNDHCYSFNEEWVIYGDAYRACAEAGGYLWTATSSAEAGEVERNLVPDDQEVWLGLTNRAVNGGWVTGETSDYRPWLSGQPNQACSLQVGNSTSDENFLTRRCSAKRPYVCEFEPAMIDPETHRAYRRYFEASSQSEAVAACAEKGGALTSLESTSERDFVFGAFGNEFWVGASSSAPGDFEWLSGQTMTEAVLEPADLGTAEGCLQHSEGEFAAADCAQALAFVCEFE